MGIFKGIDRIRNGLCSDTLHIYNAVSNLVKALSLFSSKIINNAYNKKTTLLAHTEYSMFQHAQNIYCLRPMTSLCWSQRRYENP